MIETLRVIYRRCWEFLCPIQGVAHHPQIDVKNNTKQSISAANGTEQFTILFAPTLTFSHGAIGKKNSESFDRARDWRRVGLPAMTVYRNRSAHSEIVIGLHDCYGPALPVERRQKFVPGCACSHVYDWNGIASRHRIDVAECVATHVDANTAVKQSVAAHGVTRACDRNLAVLRRGLMDKI